MGCTANFQYYKSSLQTAIKGLYSSMREDKFQYYKSSLQTFLRPLTQFCSVNLSILQKFSSNPAQTGLFRVYLRVFLKAFREALIVSRIYKRPRKSYQVRGVILF